MSKKLKSLKPERLGGPSISVHKPFLLTSSNKIEQDKQFWKPFAYLYMFQGQDYYMRLCCMYISSQEYLDYKSGIYIKIP